MEEIAPKIIFWLFAALAIGGAFVVVHGKNLIRSAFALMATLFAVAVFYVFLGADFLAGAQVLIYVGGILTLLLFGVMLTNRIYNLDLQTGTFQVVPGALVSLAVFVTLTSIIMSTPWSTAGAQVDASTSAAEAATASNTADIGTQLMTDYVLPFEVASVLLLVALLGAAMLVRRRLDL